MRINAFLGWFIVLLGSVQVLKSQVVNSTFERISSKNGISQSTVNYIIQDKKGFMWFATYGGINKYDGYSFTIYRNNPSDKNSLSNNGIIYLYEDTYGYIWAVNNTEKGIDKFDTETERFIRYSHDPKDTTTLSSNEIYHVNQDKSGNIWICTRNALNLALLDKNDKKTIIGFKHYYNTTNRRGFSMTYEDKHGNFLLFADSLYYLDRRTDKIYSAHVPLKNSLIKSLSEDKSNNIWLGTEEQGIVKLSYNIQTNKYQNVDIKKVNITPNNRNYLLIDPEGKLWICTESKGLYCYDEKKDELINFVNDKIDNTSISDNASYSLCIDHSGMLWIGTFSQGLCKYNLYKKQFLHFKPVEGNANSLSGNVISSITSSRAGELWVGVREENGGVDRFNFQNLFNPQITHYKSNPHDENSLGGNIVLSIRQRRNGEVWVGSANETVTKIIPEQPGSKGRPIMKKFKTNRWTFSIFEDSEGIIWGGTWLAGLWRYNEKDGTFTYFLHDQENPESICDNIVWSIGEDNSGNIWFGGHGEGLSILPYKEKRKDNPKFVSFKHREEDLRGLTDNTIHCVFKDHDGAMWLGTGAGLNRVIRKGNDFRTISFNDSLIIQSYHMKDGLPSEAIVGIVEDNKQNLWISTPNGLSKFNIAQNTFTNYDNRDGLQSNEFWHNSYFKDLKGWLYFGGPNGFNAFYPDSIKNNYFLPKLVFTDLKIFNKSVSMGEAVNGDVILSKPLNNTNEILLSHKNNAFTIRFAALHYTQSAENKYAYKLEGYDKDWNYIGTKREASFMNLEAGNYVLRVKGANSDGYWNKDAISLNIIVLPPWWKTWWFRSLMIIGIISLLYAIYNVRLSFYKSQQKKLTRMVIDRTKDLEESTVQLEERQEEINQQNEELMAQRDVLSETNKILLEQKLKISEQNEELYKHRNELESIVNQRTHELLIAKEKAEESDRLKSSFLANLSHEIRTPLNAIMGFSNLITQEELSEEEKINSNQIIQNSGISLLCLIDDIIDFSKMETGYINIEMVEVPLKKILENINQIFNLQLKRQQGASEKNIDFRVIMSMTADQIILKTDEIRLNQILANLINNAIKFTNEGFIEVGYRFLEKENMVEFFVKDSGIGIKKEAQEYIFERFRKVEDGSDELYRGAGLGLSISYQLVSLLGGKISVESEHTKGSTFYFTIPASISKSSVVQPLQQQVFDDIPDLQNATVIIAEDDDANYAYIHRLMQKTNSNLVRAVNGMEVLSYLDHNDDNVALVLMDIKMPVLNGIDALKEIRKRKLKIPVLAQTAHALFDEVRMLKEAGFDDYIAKPIKAEELYKLINMHLHKD